MIKLYPNGDQYEGDMVGDKKHGHGSYTWKNGDKYTGDFIDDQRTGYGELVFNDNKKYEGEFLNGKFDGNGTFYWLDGNKYVGNWKNNRAIGHGVIYYNADNEMRGDRYEGDILNFVKHGKGTYTWNNGISILAIGLMVKRLAWVFSIFTNKTNIRVSF